MDSAREHHKNVKIFYRLHNGFRLCAAFQNVEHHKKCGNTQAFNMGPTYSLRSQVRFDQVTTEWFTVQKGVRQGCILSPGLFNLHSGYIIKMGGAGDRVTGIGKVT
jgi:hypothetical protein